MTPLEWVGAIVAVLVALGIAAGGLTYMTETIARLWDRKISKAVDHQLRKQGEQMRGQEYWFTDPVQAATWRCCANVMARGGYPDAQRLRDGDYPVALAEIKKERTKS